MLPEPAEGFGGAIDSPVISARGTSFRRGGVLSELPITPVVQNFTRDGSNACFGAFVARCFVCQIVAGYARALQTALDACNALAETIDIDNGPQLKKLVDAAVGTKFSFRHVWEPIRQTRCSHSVVLLLFVLLRADEADVVAVALLTDDVCSLQQHACCFGVVLLVRMK